MAPSPLLAVCLLFLSATTGFAAEVTPDPLSSTQLSEAIDAAITRMSGRVGWFHDLRSRHNYHNADAVFSCTPDEGKWKWPSKDNAQGLWARVLSSGELRVAGVKWNQGSVADYITTPEAPTGFWPEYLEQIVHEINLEYGTAIKVKRSYYDTSNLVNAAVADGTDDMSEPYYYISGFHDNNPRIEALHFSCITVGTSGDFFALKESGITSVDQLYEAIKTGDDQLMGFIGAGNYHSVSSILPEEVIPVYVTNGTDLAMQVTEGKFLAGYVSEGRGSMDVEAFSIFPTGIVQPRVALFRKDEPTCEAVITTVSESSDDDEFAGTAGMITVVALAATTLILGAIIGLLVTKEKAGNPLFTPLVNEPNMA